MKYYEDYPMILNGFILNNLCARVIIISRGAERCSPEVINAYYMSRCSVVRCNFVWLAHVHRRFIIKIILFPRRDENNEFHQSRSKIVFDPD